MANPPENSWVEVGKVEDFATSTTRAVQLNGQEICLIRDGIHFRALLDSCPHKGNPLTGGWVENGKIFCPMHGWGFELESGQCVDRPEKKVKTFPLKIENGRLYLQSI